MYELLLQLPEVLLVSFHHEGMPWCIYLMKMRMKLLIWNEFLLECSMESEDHYNIKAHDRHIANGCSGGICPLLLIFVQHCALRCESIISYNLSMGLSRCLLKLILSSIYYFQCKVLYKAGKGCISHPDGKMQSSVLAHLEMATYSAL